MYKIKQLTFHINSECQASLFIATPSRFSIGSATLKVSVKWVTWQQLVRFFADRWQGHDDI